ncbi:hypothetical protein GCM10010424_21950 [Streptomyces lienomycini]
MTVDCGVGGIVADHIARTLTGLADPVQPVPEALGGQSACVQGQIEYDIAVVLAPVRRADG